MDPVTILTTTQSVLHLTKNVVAFVISFKEGADGYDKKLDGLVGELESLQSVVQNVEICLETTDLGGSIGISANAGDTTLDGLHKSLQNCYQSIDDFSDLFAEFTTDEKLHFMQRGAKAKKLEWRLDRFVEVRQKLQTHQQAIQVSLTTIHLRVTMKSNGQDAGQFQKLYRMMMELSANVRRLGKTKRDLEATQKQNQTLGASATQVFQDLDAVEETSKQMEKAAKKELTKRQLKYGHKIVQPPLPPRPVQSQEQPEESELPSARVVKDDLDGPVTVASVPTPGTGREVLASGQGMSRQSGLSAPHAIRASVSTSALVDSKELVDELPMSEIPSQAFENSIQAILGDAGRHKKPKKPFIDEDFDKVEDLLRRVGKPQWAQRPRTYIILHLIEQVSLMDDFVLHGMKDINLPYSQERLPQFVRGHSVRHEFIQQQNLVLSPKSADLIKGGRHRHIGGHQGAEAHFVIVRTLGRGGQGVVDVVRHKMAWQEYARKRIHRSKTFAKDKKGLESFENEVNNLKRLEHTHLVRFVGSYTDTNFVGIIMDPVADCDLRQYLDITVQAAFHPDNLAHIRRFMGCLCAAVQYLHKEKCRHKDLKPANILVKNDTVLITDFGIALDSSALARDTTTGPSAAYTAAYAAPEVINPDGRRSWPADMYSLGCVYLDMMTILKRQRLEERESFYTQEGTHSRYNCQNPQALVSWIETLEAIDNESNIPLAWIRRMTAVDPDDRPTAAPLLAEIQNASRGPNDYCGECCCEEFSSETEEDLWEGSESEAEEYDAQNTSHSYTLGSARSYNNTNQSADRSYADKSEPTTLTMVSTGSQQMSPLNIKRQDSIASNDAAGVPLISFTEVPDRDAKKKVDDKPEEKSPKKIKEKLVETTRFIKNKSDFTRTNDESEDTEDRIRELLQSTVKQLEEYLLKQQDNHGPSWLPSRLKKLCITERDWKDYTLLHKAARFHDAKFSLQVAKAALDTGADANAINFVNNTALHYAAAEVEKADLVKLLLDHGADPGVPNIRLQTPMHIAARQGSPNALEHLAAASRELSVVNEQDDSGRTALHLAAAACSLTKAGILIHAGANPYIKDKEGVDCVDYCADELRNDFKYLLTNSKISSGSWSTGQQSSKSEDSDSCGCETCRILDVVEPLKDKDGESVFTCPCSFHFKILAAEMVSDIDDLEYDLKECGCTECKDAVAKYEELNKRKPKRQANCQCADCQKMRDALKNEFNDIIDKAIQGPCPCKECEAVNKEAATKMLADAGFVSRRGYVYDAASAWTWAIENCEGRGDRPMTSVAELLHERNPSVVTKTDSYGMTMLHKAASYGYLGLAKFLIDSGANIDHPGARRFTPLRWAVGECQSATVMLLLREGADVNFLDSSRQTALHDVIMNYKTHEEIIPLLLAYEAKLDIADEDGITPLGTAIALENLDATRVLIEAGADVNVLSPMVGTALGMAITNNESQMIQLLLESGARMEEGRSGISFAAIGGRGTSMVELLSYKTANNIVDSDDKTSLDWTFNVRELDTSDRSVLHHMAKAKALEIQKCATALVKECQEADILNQKDDHGNTALHAAALAGSTLMVRALTSHGAYKHAVNYDGKTAIDIAHANRSREIVEMLGGEYVEKKKRWWRR